MRSLKKRIGDDYVKKRVEGRLELRLNGVGRFLFPLHIIPAYHLNSLNELREIMREIYGILSSVLSKEGNELNEVYMNEG